MAFDGLFAVAAAAVGRLVGWSSLNLGSGEGLGLGSGGFLESTSTLVPGSHALGLWEGGAFSLLVGRDTGSGDCWLGECVRFKRKKKNSINPYYSAPSKNKISRNFFENS